MPRIQERKVKSEEGPRVSDPTRPSRWQNENGRYTRLACVMSVDNGGDGDGLSSSSSRVEKPQKEEIIMIIGGGGLVGSEGVECAGFPRDCAVSRAL